MIRGNDDATRLPWQDVEHATRLSARAAEMAAASADVGEAVKELRALARGRTDLLAEAVSNLLDDRLDDPSQEGTRAMHSVGLLIAAGADPTAVSSIFASYAEPRDDLN